MSLEPNDWSEVDLASQPTDEEALSEASTQFLCPYCDIGCKYENELKEMHKPKLKLLPVYKTRYWLSHHLISKHYMCSGVWTYLQELKGLTNGILELGTIKNIQEFFAGKDVQLPNFVSINKPVKRSNDRRYDSNKEGELSMKPDCLKVEKFD